MVKPLQNERELLRRPARIVHRPPGASRSCGAAAQATHFEKRERLCEQGETNKQTKSTHLDTEVTNAGLVTREEAAQGAGAILNLKLGAVGEVGGGLA